MSRLGMLVVCGLVVLLADTCWAQVTQRVSVASDGTQGNDVSSFPSISADGRYVAFSSAATNLVPGDTNGYSDVFVRDRQSSATERVSLDSVEVQGNGHSYSPSISADDRHVAFESAANNLKPSPFRILCSTDGLHPLIGVGSDMRNKRWNTDSLNRPAKGRPTWAGRRKQFQHSTGGNHQPAGSDSGRIDFPPCTRARNNSRGLDCRHLLQGLDCPYCEWESQDGQGKREVFLAGPTLQHRFY